MAVSFYTQSGERNCACKVYVCVCTFKHIDLWVLQSSTLDSSHFVVYLT